MSYRSIERAIAIERTQAMNYHRPQISRNSISSIDLKTPIIILMLLPETVPTSFSDIGPSHDRVSDGGHNHSLNDLVNDSTEEEKEGGDDDDDDDDDDESNDGDDDEDEDEKEASSSSSEDNNDSDDEDHKGHSNLHKPLAYPKRSPCRARKPTLTDCLPESNEAASKVASYANKGEWLIQGFL
ncbi:hypothetical protein K469DRAFT_693611 [Zopfia rhizophila CBS 207.26]|uniref:Uncharacterized protein n=1 Tax=Zopfia rhizophila CBS 207.26 TaxID=1314779 RepID=A0A6A6DK77_9PEZI|nr:hypothetical protein K469DRAFT_693611 [Zopfia rhizophila CBS 207.26]